MQKKFNLPHTRFWGRDISDVSGCCLSHLLFLTEGVTEEKLTALLIFNTDSNGGCLCFLTNFFVYISFLAVSTFTRRIPSFSVVPEDH